MRTLSLSFTTTFIGVFPMTSLLDGPLLFDVPVEYDLNEARAVYQERRRACLDSSGQLVTETLTGSRRLSISEMKWAYCRR